MQAAISRKSSAGARSPAGFAVVSPWVMIRRSEHCRRFAAVVNRLSETGNNRFLGRSQVQMSVLRLGPPPPALQAAIARVARERFGAGDLAGAELARAVRRVSDAYTRIEGDPETLAGDRAALCARLKF